jgi:hypothetical protein
LQLMAVAPVSGLSRTGVGGADGASENAEVQEAFAFQDEFSEQQASAAEKTDQQKKQEAAAQQTAPRPAPFSAATLSQLGDPGAVMDAMLAKHDPSKLKRVGRNSVAHQVYIAVGVQPPPGRAD